MYLFMLFALFGSCLFTLNKYHFAVVYFGCSVLFMCIPVCVYKFICYDFDLFSIIVMCNLSFLLFDVHCICICM